MEMPNGTAKYSSEAFRERFGPWAVVAGGSDGIGAAFGEVLVRRGLNVVLLARSESKLAAEAAHLRALSSAGPHAASSASRPADPSAPQRVEIRTACVELTSADVAERVADVTAGLDVGLFIYNAGSGRNMGSFLDAPVENWTRQVDLACSGPLRLSHHFGRRMRDRGRGGIVLMSSLSSLVGSAYIATYSAAKAFDTIFGEGLWYELAPAGIDVLSCLAGATDTETFREDTGGSPLAMDPIEVADGTLDFLGRGPIYVPGAANQAGARASWPVPRIPLINTMSQLNAKSFGLPWETRKGTEFGDA